MSTYDFSASSQQKVLIPMAMNVQDHMVYFRYSTSGALTPYIEFQVAPVVMDGRNIVIQLPIFSETIYYRIISKKLGQYYYHQNGQISYVSNAGGGGLGPNTVSSSEIVDGTIVNADISPSAAINPAKIAGTAATVNQMPVFLTDSTRPGVLIIEHNNI